MKAALIDRYGSSQPLFLASLGRALAAELQAVGPITSISRRIMRRHYRAETSQA